jgi:anthranilate/para-aminobenzoate synthase component I
MDTNILIRSIFSSEKWLQFGAGGGIVADSKPDDEYLETLNKASGIIKAIRSHPNSTKLIQL